VVGEEDEWLLENRSPDESCKNNDARLCEDGWQLLESSHPVVLGSVQIYLCL
jgi:hypothetical protein